MSSKLFVKAFFPFSLIIFFLLPGFNYYIDQWRVLHKDYEHQYKEIEPNKNYLKMSYLLEHKKQYNSIAFGSSRLGNMDLEKYYPNMYNMTYSFGHIKTHLENLKILLSHNVPIDEILLGVDDFYIFKNPDDFNNDYLRKSYPTNLSEIFEFYKFYLFKKPQKRDIDLFLGLYPMENSLYITKPNNMEKHTKIALELSSDKLHTQKMVSNDIFKMQQYISQYRVDDVIEEIRQFKMLCDEKNIKLTIFFNPTYFVSYLKYNQEKIHDFKKELSNISKFHDFYILSDYTLDENNWFDPIHFTPTIGNDILKSIKDNTHLVDQNSIDSYINESSHFIKKILNKKYPMFELSPTIDLSKLKGEKVDFTKLKGKAFIKNENIFYTTNVIISLDIDSLSKDKLNVVIDEKEAFSLKINQGSNIINFTIDVKNLNKGIYLVGKEDSILSSVTIYYQQE